MSRYLTTELYMATNFDYKYGTAPGADPHFHLTCNDILPRYDVSISPSTGKFCPCQDEVKRLRYLLYTTPNANDLFGVSSDMGASWTLKGDFLSWGKAAAISSTGQYQIVCGYPGNIYISSDYGATWASKTPSLNYIGAEISSTGQYMSVVPDNGYVYTSSDYGVNWINRGLPSIYYTGIAMSQTGAYQTAVSNGYIYVSTNYGVSWTQKNISASYAAVSMSYSGQYQTVSTGTTAVYTSSDYGATWVQRLSIGAVSIAQSASGQYVYFVNNQNNSVYLSTDFGAMWIAGDTFSQNTSICCSATGKRIFLTGYTILSGFGIYEYDNFGATWIGKISSGSKVVVVTNR